MQTATVARTKKSPAKSPKTSRNAKPSAPSGERRDVCAEVTAKLVAALEKGTAPWVKPWKGDGGVPALMGMPYNAVTKKPYHGANVLVLWCAGYSDPRWLTYRQAQEMGGNVRAGQKGQTICWWSPVRGKTEKVEGENGEEEAAVQRTRLVCRAYTVFNVEQCEGLDFGTQPEETEKPEAIQSPVDAVAARVGAKITFGGTRAFYSPTGDHIGMPVLAAFESQGAYDATLSHELAHWTGAPNRCDRKFGTRFGDSAYAFEELVAEIASAFVCAFLGIEGKLQHAEYLGHWAKVLKGDKFAIFTAAREAEKAAAFLIPAMGRGSEPAETPAAED